MANQLLHESEKERGKTNAKDDYYCEYFFAKNKNAANR